jgi:hypothetical protein
VATGAGAFAGDMDKGVALEGGVGELADSVDFCSHAMTRKLAKAMGTIKRVFIPINTDV